MTMQSCNKYIARMKSVNDMRFWLAAIRDNAASDGEYIVRNAYDDMLYYLQTGRLSASCEKNILANIRTVVKTLNHWKGGTTNDIGMYLESFYE